MKEMTLEELSSIRGAVSSEAIEELFNSIKSANPKLDENSVFSKKVDAVDLDSLRDDVVAKSSIIERKIIVDNFPKEKNGFLVVLKVIED